MQKEDILLNLPDKKQWPKIEKGIKTIVRNLLMAPESLLTNPDDCFDSLPLTNHQLQMALLSLSERLGSAASTNQVIVHEIAQNRDSWASTVGFKAVLATAQQQAIDVETQIALINMSDVLATDSFIEKMALCHNVAEVLQEQVIFFLRKSTWI